MHYILIEDADGNLTDALPHCSDACARTHPTYAGWNGAHETLTTEFCHACGVVIGGDPVTDDAWCECKRTTVVNLAGARENVWCEHGNLVRAG
jgi:hypothetical protein